MTGRLAGKAAVVTGGGSGIGRATAARLAAEGASVVLADMSPAAADVAREIDPGGGQVIFRQADVRDSGQVHAAFAAALAEFGRCDIAVNNAGIIAGGPITDDDADEHLDALWQVCVAGVWHGCRAALACMRPRGGGVILNTASSAALWPTPASPAYGLAKAAVLHLTRSLAVAYGPDGVRVNAVLPGPTKTAIFASAGVADPGLEARYAAAIPLGSMIEPAEIAAAFAYLASDEAASVTGAALQVDGAFRPGGR